MGKVYEALNYIRPVSVLGDVEFIQDTLYDCLLIRIQDSESYKYFVLRL